MTGEFSMRECREGVMETESLDNRAVAAKQSSAETERLIEEFRPLLNSRVGRYAPESDLEKREELFSAAMAAFYEAIRKFDPGLGHFAPFADRVVRLRVADALRNIRKHEGKTVSLDEIDDSGSTDKTDAVSMREYNARRGGETLVEEIEQFRLELSEWGITMQTLVKQSPKQRKQRETYRELVSKALNDPEVVMVMKQKKYLPVKKISEISGLPQKKIERARTYIVASLIIRLGDYDYLSGYIGGS